jgi:hypothetical protein
VVYGFCCGAELCMLPRCESPEGATAAAVDGGAGGVACAMRAGTCSWGRHPAHAMAAAGAAAQAAHTSSEMITRDDGAVRSRRRITGSFVLTFLVAETHTAME